MRRLIGKSFVVALMCLAFCPSIARAQSAIVGVVKDTTGAVIPGATVEVASPQLIEKIRSVTTDDRGAYQIRDLRPGVYSITVSLQGFSTVRRNAIELPTDFTATVNADLRVGELEETVTVSGASPVVDVQSAAKGQVMSREILDAIPTGRTAQSYGQLVTGVTNAQPDVGGAHAMNQVGMLLHGNAGQETTVTLDGIQLNGMCGNGSTQAYTNTQSYEEMVFQTTTSGADVSTGGVRQNMVPRQGGNDLHGSMNAYGSRHTWQAASISPDLIARGLTKGDSLDGLYDLEGGLGGKIVKDRVWWFAAARKISANTAVADTFYPDGTQGVLDQYVENASIRLTTQLSPRNKFTAYIDRVNKYEGHDMLAGYDPVKASRVWEPSKLYQQLQGKWTSTVSNRLLFEAGYGEYRAQRHTTYQPGVEPPYGTLPWFAAAYHMDTSLGTVTNAAPGGNYYLIPVRRFFSSSASYVSGSHTMKFGAQDTWGFLEQGTTLNGAVGQIYQNGVPTSAAIYNTPERDRFTMNAQWGLYAQDTWTVRRLTINYGMRWEYFHSSIAAESSTAGVYVPDRSFGPQDMPIWKTWAPRLGIVYDLRGNAKTAVKFSVNKYELSATNGVAAALNPMRLQSATVTWRDLNGDDVIQQSPGCTFNTAGCEINYAQLPKNFGLITPGCSTIATPGVTPCGTAQVDPNVQRPYEVMYNIGIQHELLPRVSVTANWVRTNFYALALTQNTLQSFSDYTLTTIANPITGSPIAVYNVSAAKQSAVLNLNTTDPQGRRWNNAIEIAFNARFPGGATLFGGTATDRTTVVQCDGFTNPNMLLYCDQTQNGIPWNPQFKLAGSMPLRYGLQLGASYTTYKYTYGTATAGSAWLITPTTRYPANCLGACTPGALVDPGMTVASLSVPLIPPGTEFSDRVKQMDVTLRKNVAIGKLRLEPGISLFNAFNNHAAYAVRSMNYLTSSYLQPSTVLQPRLLRLEMQVKW
ncbi:MAG: Outer rane receptor for ferrienterochelin and colicin [Acidobacteria bacterium]|nr:Outer rane receptor for ferrienterochelin and colicin [Acidobacteriota bacterium]